MQKNIFYIAYKTRRDARHVSRLDSLSHFFFIVVEIADLFLGAAAAVLTHRSQRRLAFSQRPGAHTANYGISSECSHETEGALAHCRACVQNLVNNRVTCCKIDTADIRNASPSASRAV